MNTNLLTTISYGVKRGFKKFRKNLTLDFKFGNKHSHKNTHAMPLQLKQRLLNVQKGGNWNKIRQIQRNSLTPFGKFTKKGFIFQKQKIPFYDIPNVEGFELKPYVDFNAPKINQKYRDHQQKVNQKKLQEISKLQS